MQPHSNSLKLWLLVPYSILLREGSSKEVANLEEYFLFIWVVKSTLTEKVQQIIRVCKEIFEQAAIFVASLEKSSQTESLGKLFS